MGSNGIYFNDRGLGNCHIPYWVNKGSRPSGGRTTGSGAGWAGRENVKHGPLLSLKHHNSPSPLLLPQPRRPGQEKNFHQGNSAVGRFSGSIWIMACWTQGREWGCGSKAVIQSRGPVSPAVSAYDMSYHQDLEMGHALCWSVFCLACFFGV